MRAIRADSMSGRLQAVQVIGKWSVADRRESSQRYLIGGEGRGETEVLRVIDFVGGRCLLGGYVMCRRDGGGFLWPDYGEKEEQLGGKGGS